MQLFLKFNPTIPDAAACALFKLTRCIRTWPSDLDDQQQTHDESTQNRKHSSLLFLIITMNACNTCLFVLTLKYFLLLLLGTWVLSLIIQWRWMTMSINFLALLTFISATWTELRRSLDFDACHNAARALILSKLDYCSWFLNGLTQKWCNTTNINSYGSILNIKITSSKITCQSTF